MRLIPTKWLLAALSFFSIVPLAFGGQKVCEKIFATDVARENWKDQWALSAQNSEYRDFFAEVKENEWVSFWLNDGPVVAQVVHDKELKQFSMTTPLVKTPTRNGEVFGLEKYENFDKAMKSVLFKTIRRNKRIPQEELGQGEHTGTIIVMTYINSQGIKNIIAGSLSVRDSKIVVSKKQNWDSKIFEGIDTLGKTEVEISLSDIVQIWSLEPDILDVRFQRNVVHFALALRSGSM